MCSPEISIIVPVYNVEKYLHKCVDSILSQTLSDFELLLVDDGSKDSSGNICDDYASIDSRIHVIHKKNGGVSSARNVGLDAAKGKYIVFVDSDDFVDSDYLETLYPKNDEDLVCCSFVLENATSQSSWNVFLSDCYGSKKALEENLTKFVFCAVYCKIYKRDIIHTGKVRFNELLSQCEDGMFVFDYLCAIHCKIRTKPKAAYHYRWDYRERNSYKNFPMEQSYLLMDLLSNRLEKIYAMYGCSNVQYMQQEMICSQMYNVYRTIKDSNNTIWWKLEGLFALLRNKNIRILLMDNDFWHNHKKSRSVVFFFLCRLFNSIVSNKNYKSKL